MWPAHPIKQPFVWLKTSLVRSLNSLNWFLPAFYMTVVPPTDLKKPFLFPAVSVLSKGRIEWILGSFALWLMWCLYIHRAGETLLRLPQGTMMAQMCTSPPLHNRDIIGFIFWIQKYRFQRLKILTLSTTITIPQISACVRRLTILWTIISPTCPHKTEQKEIVAVID